MGKFETSTGKNLSTSSEHVATFEQIRSSARETVGTTAVPIFGSVAPAGLIGSGFVVTSGEDDVLVTAGHVLEECLPSVTADGTIANGLLFKTERESVPISGGITLSKRGNKNYDLGIVKLHDQVRSGATWKTVPRATVEVGAKAPLTGLYVALGFPLSRSRSRPSLRRSDSVMMPVFAVPASLPKYLELGFDPADNLLLDYDQHDANGRPRFEPKGMSGGPVWGFRWDESGIHWLLEAVLIERYKKQRVLRCMRIKEVLKQIDLTPEAKRRTA